jgi:hypothetical protein
MTWLSGLIGFISGVVASYVYSRLRRVCRKFTVCNATIMNLGMWSDDEPFWQWYAEVNISVPRKRGWFADPMKDKLAGRVIIDEEGKGHSGGFRDTRWIGFHSTFLLDIPENRIGKLLLLSQSFTNRKVYILDHVSYGTPLKQNKYVLRVQIYRLSDNKVLDNKNFPVNITKHGIVLDSNSSSSEPRNHIQVNQYRTNPRSELRILVELFSLTTIFLLTGILSFSSFFTTLQQKTEIHFFNSTFDFNLPYNHEVLFVLGCIYVILGLVSFVLVFLPRQARQMGEWIEFSDSKLNRFFWSIFLPLLWIGLNFTFVIGLVDASSKLPGPLWNSISLEVGFSLYILISIILIGRGIRRTWMM